MIDDPILEILRGFRTIDTYVFDKIYTELLEVLNEYLEPYKGENYLQSSPITMGHNYFLWGLPLGNNLDDIAAEDMKRYVLDKGLFWVSEIDIGTVTLVVTANCKICDIDRNKEIAKNSEMFA